MQLITRPVTSLGHQVGRRVFWEGLKFFKPCPIVLKICQTHFYRGVKNFARGASPPPGYGPVNYCPLMLLFFLHVAFVLFRDLSKKMHEYTIYNFKGLLLQGSKQPQRHQNNSHQNNPSDIKTIHIKTTPATSKQFASKQPQRPVLAIAMFQPYADALNLLHNWKPGVGCRVNEMFEAVKRHWIVRRVIYLFEKRFLSWSLIVLLCLSAWSFRSTANVRSTLSRLELFT